MDAELEQALAASLADQNEDDIQLREAIRLSQMESSIIAATPQDDQHAKQGKITEKTPMTQIDQLAEYRKNMALKRKAEDDLRPSSSMKQSNTATISMSRSLAEASYTKSSSSRAPKVSIAYPNGALRITRTPGRKNAKNCISLEDLTYGQHLVSACAFSFFIAEEEFFAHLPLSDEKDAAPIYIGRDPNQDSMVLQACQQAGIEVEHKVSNRHLISVEPSVRRLCKSTYGRNYEAFYAWSSGSSHSKILLLVYPEFLRIVITSCNMMNIDTIGGDNHWYIHDLPKLSSKSKLIIGSFEDCLLKHLEALSTPAAFIDSIQGRYDYSKVKVHLVTSIPGVKSQVNADKHGLLRLRHIVRSLDLGLAEMEGDELRLEVCMASIGNLNAKWLNGFYDCALGEADISVAKTDSDVPDLRLFYPSMDDVRQKADADAQEAASNIGCHTRPWEDASADVKNIFHHYESKDSGRLFHQKLILAYNPADTNAMPYYVYVGSANFSQSAWGSLEKDKKANVATNNTKLIKMSNFECGVVIPGGLIEGLLEKGTKNWQTGIVPYVQTAKKYDLSKEKAWNDARWVQSPRENY